MDITQQQKNEVTEGGEKSMKKLMSLIMTVLFAFGVTAASFAAEAPKTDKGAPTVEEKKPETDTTKKVKKTSKKKVKKHKKVKKAAKKTEKKSEEKPAAETK